MRSTCSGEGEGLGPLPNRATARAEPTSTKVMNRIVRRRIAAAIGAAAPRRLGALPACVAIRPPNVSQRLSTFGQCIKNSQKTQVARLARMQPRSDRHQRVAHGSCRSPQGIGAGIRPWAKVTHRPKTSASCRIGQARRRRRCRPGCGQIAYDGSPRNLRLVTEGDHGERGHWRAGPCLKTNSKA